MSTLSFIVYWQSWVCGRSGTRRQDMLPLLVNARIEFVARSHDARKSVSPCPWLACINYDACIAWILGAVGHGIEHGAPAAAQHFHAFARIKARAHRPDHLV